MQHNFGHTFFLLNLRVLLQGNFLTRDGLGASQGICQYCLHLSSPTATFLHRILQITWLQLSSLVITFITSLCHQKITMHFTSTEEQVTQKGKVLYYAITIPEKFLIHWFESQHIWTSYTTVQVQALGKQLRSVEIFP